MTPAPTATPPLTAVPDRCSHSVMAAAAAMTTTAPAGPVSAAWAANGRQSARDWLTPGGAEAADQCGGEEPHPSADGPTRHEGSCCVITRRGHPDNSPPEDHAHLHPGQEGQQDGGLRAAGEAWTCQHAHPDRQRGERQHRNLCPAGAPDRRSGPGRLRSPVMSALLNMSDAADLVCLCRTNGPSRTLRYGRYGRVPSNGESRGSVRKITVSHPGGSRMVRPHLGMVGRGSEHAVLELRQALCKEL